MGKVQQILGAFLLIVVLTAAFVLLQDIPEVRRFTDRAVRTVSLVGLALFALGLVFVIAHRLGASTERSHASDSTSAPASIPSTYQAAMPQILMLPPAQSNLPREVWERPLSSNQNMAEVSAPRKIDWSVIS